MVKILEESKPSPDSAGDQHRQLIISYICKTDHLANEVFS